jgi:hypothetical protein
MFFASFFALTAKDGGNAEIESAIAVHSHILAL